ncbi:MAG: DNA polymerase III subunit epsilon [Phyllobacterium sp.]
MREIIFDTETTGLERLEDRIIEIGCIEMINRFPTGKTFHVYINPDGRKIHPDALAVHGIGEEKLAGKPVFSAIANDFLDFTDGATLLAHNATFDMGFINAELNRLGHAPIGNDRVVDTLALARRKHPMGPNSLDALCKRYGIDNSHRTMHGALLDAQLLAEVYIELIGGKQAALGLSVSADADARSSGQSSQKIIVPERPVPLPSRLTEEERAAHSAMVSKIGDKAIWLKYSDTEK